MDERTNGHLLWTVLDYQGRSLKWLARATEFSESHIWAMKGGRFAPSAKFRGAAAKALDLPEWLLFDAADSRDDAPDARVGRIAAVTQ